MSSYTIFGHNSNNAIKILMLMGSLFQGSAVFAYGPYSISAGSKIIINLQDNYSYLIPGGACGSANKTMQGPTSHVCEARDGAEVDIVLNDNQSIYCAFSGTVTDGKLTLNPAGRAKNCSQILASPPVQQGQNLIVNIKNKSPKPTPITLRLLNGNTNTYTITPSDKACQTQSLDVRARYDCTFEGSKDFKMTIDGGPTSNCTLTWKNAGFSSNGNCKGVVAVNSTTGSTFLYDLQ